MSSRLRFGLLGLAPELIGNVVAHVNGRADLSNTRLTCKTLNTLASKELYKDVHLSPASQHIESWNSINQHDGLRHIPRHAIIHTQSDVEDHGLGWGRREREEYDDDFKGALNALSRFPNLDSIEIEFTPECAGSEDEWSEVAEDRYQREETLNLIFQAVKDRAGDEKNKKIRKLTIVNLQNFPLPEFTSSDLFRDVMGQLDELHISTLQEFNEHGPDQDYEKNELQDWPKYFLSDWLKPISANLKSLSLYHGRDNWGPFPGYYDFSDITFPKLETLAMGRYTMAHDDSFDWVLATKSLRKLILHNCMIASWLHIYRDNLAAWNPPMHDWIEYESDQDNWSRKFTYAGKWSNFIDRIATELPNLVDFRFDTGTTRSGKYPDAYSSGMNLWAMEFRETCRVRPFARRYASFDNGLLPDPWVEAEDDDGTVDSFVQELEGVTINMHEETLEEDQKSLDALVEKLRVRNSTSQSGST